MDETSTRKALEQLVDAIRAGDARALAARISTEWLDGKPRPGQPAAPDVWNQLTGDVFTAFGKPEVKLDEVRADGEALAAKLTVAGTHSGVLWGMPGTGKRISVTTTIRARLAGERLAVGFSDVSLIATLREIGVVPMPDVAHVPLTWPISIPEVIMKIVFNGGALEKPCTHLAEVKLHEPKTRRCAKCVETGTPWPALRMCLTCGHVGCCDVAAGKHAIKHQQESSHPLIRSINADETWIWCYVDKTILSARW